MNTTPHAYRTLTTETIASYVRPRAALAERLGGDPAGWRAEERGDGNLNLVFIVTGTAGGIVVKQALPYVRLVGESWPLPLTRSHFEHAALAEQSRWAPGLLPQVYDADPVMALIAMEYLSPHVILRKGLIAANVYPSIGTHLGRFLAQTAFNTSDLHLAAGAKKQLVARFLGNAAMCKITEDLIFDEPYFAAPLNRHTSPQLDHTVAAMARDVELKLAVQKMKWRFMNLSECLVHGDLHTGSIMVTETDTRVIDPEFAFCGPMGFDVGMLLGNFLLAALSQAGHESIPGERISYRGHILLQMQSVWDTFSKEFSRLWNMRESRHGGELYSTRLAVDSPGLAAAGLQVQLERIWRDGLGFAGCEMIRRIVGLAHIEDFEAITDAARRSRCEAAALAIARELLVERGRFRSIGDVAAAAGSRA